jgi:hypothetical protein
MKRSTTTISGTFHRSRTALLMLGMLAVVFASVAPLPAQDEFPWATKVNVVCPTKAEFYQMLAARSSSLDWMNNLLNDPNLSEYDIEINFSFLTNGLITWNREPHFTPDGKWIEFDDRSAGIWKVPVEGGEPKLAFPFYTQMTYNSDRSEIIGGTVGIWGACGLSPDGKRVIGIEKTFGEDSPAMGPNPNTLPDGSPASGYMLKTFATHLLAGNFETGEKEVIVKDAIDGRWSRDGSMFAYVKRNPDIELYPGTYTNLWSWEQIITGLYVMDVSTGTSRQIATLATCPYFSSDDTAVICSMKDATGFWQIFSIPLDGSSTRQLTFYGPSDNGRNARVSDVSPSGEWVLHTGDYTVNGLTKTGLCVCNTVTGISYPLFPEADCITTDGSWSPDGKKIVLSVSYPFYDEIGRGHNGFALYIMDFNPDDFQKSTAVAEALPSGFAISGNYPNPFNPTTTISFSLPVAGTVSLAVYDVTGRKVRELVNGSLTRGAHSAVWDGSDSAGRSVSSGVYLSRLTMNGKTTANRMLLAK